MIDKPLSLPFGMIIKNEIPTFIKFVGMYAGNTASQTESVGSGGWLFDLLDEQKVKRDDDKAIKFFSFLLSLVIQYHN